MTQHTTDDNLYIAYDPVVKRRCPHIKVKSKFISLVTGHSFREEDDES